MYIIKRRALSLLLSFSMILGIMQMFTLDAFAADPVNYQPMVAEYAILNRFIYQNKDYFSTYVKNSNLYNAVEKFTGTQPEKLAPDTKYNRLKGNFTWRNFADPSATITNLAFHNQLQVNLSATLHNNLHRHGSIFAYTDSLAYQFAYIESGEYRQYITGLEFSSDGTATKRLGDMEFTPINFYNLSLTVGVGRTFKDCNDGDCYISDMTVVFADITDPRVQSVYTCDDNGNAQSLVKEGDPIYLKVEFTEPVRFADNSADHSDITAIIKDSNDHELTGNLVELRNNYIMFRFNNTSLDSFGSDNITITSVDLNSLFGDGSWDFTQVRAGDSVTRHINSQKFNGPGFTTSSSLITDIAGNPLRKPSSNSTAALSTACYIDGEGPYATNISKTAKLNNSDVKSALGKTDPASPGYPDASDTSVGAGDSITYTVNFNEKLNINGRNYNSNDFRGMKARLNVYYLSTDSESGEEIKTMLR